MSINVKLKYEWSVFYMFLCLFNFLSLCIILGKFYLIIAYANTFIIHLIPENTKDAEGYQGNFIKNEPSE